jgi:endonuclease/exonuclease/phosphatase family metal-dependent hydrolase
MTALGDVARRAPFSPFPSLGKLITQLDPGVLRSAFTGQANAILVRSDAVVLDHRRVVLNPFRFRRAQSRRLALERAARLGWTKERRICQTIRIRHGEGTLVVGNLHATSYPPDKRIADVELLRAATFVDGVALPGEPLLLCGDFNISRRFSHTLAQLMTDEWGFSGATPTGIDHLLVRGLRAGAPRVWPPEERERDGRLLSDHAPVDVELE